MVLAIVKVGWDGFRSGKKQFSDIQFVILHSLTFSEFDWILVIVEKVKLLTGEKVTYS